MTSADDSRAIRFLAALLAAVLAAAGGAAGEAPLTFVLTADIEGRLAGDDAFARDPGRGALARKAAAIADLRRKDKVLLLDAGNAFFGPESLPSGGKVVAAAYGAMGYGAVNLSWRDFRLGKDRTLALQGECPFPVVTTNIADEASGDLLGRPYAVLRAGDRRIAILGASEPPPANR